MYHKWHSYDVWFLTYEAWQIEFFAILDCFLPFYPLLGGNNLKNQNFEKLKKTPGEIIILHKCTKNHHMLYCSWDMTCNIIVFCLFFFSFWAIFCPFTSLTAWKIKIILKNEKNAWRYHNFTYVYQKLWSDDVWFLRYGVWQTDGQIHRQTEKVTYTGGCPT